VVAVHQGGAAAAAEVVDGSPGRLCPGFFYLPLKINGVSRSKSLFSASGLSLTFIITVFPEME
jgi:hypothetical protein